MFDITSEVHVGDEIIAQQLRFKVTCESYPEQYDVFNSDGEYVAYVRCRHGVLFVYLTLPPDENGHRSIDWYNGLIYREEYEDHMTGVISNRLETLNKIANEINKKQLKE